MRIINQAKASLYDAGYLEADVVSKECDSLSCTIFFRTGPTYVWNKISLDDELKSLPSSAEIRISAIEGKPIAPDKIKGVSRRLLTYFENNGYPFAAIRYQDVRFEGSKVSATISVIKGDLILMDSIAVSGDCKLSKTYLTNYLSISAGDVYDERLVRRIADRLKELPMVSEIRPFTVAFSQDKCRLTLYLKDKKSSQIDGIIGVQPPSANAGGDAKTRVTADVRIRLLSSFGRGELFDFNWKQPSPLTQNLKAKFSYPFLFNTPFGADAGIAIFKQDTTYVDVELEGGAQFILDGGNYLKVFVKDKRSNLVSTDRYKNATVLPPFADVRKTLYGAALRKFELDYRLNPRKGYATELSMSAGNRIVEVNSALPEALYDSVELKSLQINGEVSASIFLPLANRLVLACQVKGGWTAGEGLFENELYRVGGISTIRGFDEESIRAESYAIATTEIRFLLDRNSNLKAFFDQGWYERGADQNYIRDIPFGFGAGISFDSKLGIFSIDYALGSEQGNPILFKSAKVHFGVVNYF
ncbi:MAG: BamA/TamA family outer membrane protein [Bacteroidota bacterium]